MKKILFVMVFLNIKLYAEIIEFSSANPFSFSDIINSFSEQETINIFGELKFPDKKENKEYPLVIGVAGSLGWKKHHYDQLKIFRDMGIATFELNSFKSRGISSTVGTQTEVTTAMMILDSYKALDVLAQDLRINAEKIAIVGWSLGGGTALFSGWNTLIEAINPQYNFAAHLSYYPPCVAIPDNLDFTTAPIHILIGEIDDWTPSFACEELVLKLNKKGYDAAITVFENSHHSFDSELELIEVGNGYSLKDCSFKIRDDGAVVMNFMEIPMTTPFLQKIGLFACADRGTTIAGNSKARNLAHEFSKSFMSKYLLKN